MNKSITKNDYYISSDISLCSALCCFGYQIEDVDKQNPAKVVFLIKKDGQLDSLIQQYFTHQLRVEPLSFFYCLKEIKTRIYNS